jgi:hypothetical protein
MDRFIEENEVDDEVWVLVFVDCLDNYYDEPSMVPTDADSDPDSPFLNKSPEECFKLLHKLREDTESEIATDLFVIVDERSAQDDTVLLVVAGGNDAISETEGWEMKTLRVTFQASGQAMVLYMTGHSSMDEDRELAEREEDGVYRGLWSTHR